MRKKISKVWGKISKIDQNLRKKWGKWNSCPPGTVRLPTALRLYQCFREVLICIKFGQNIPLENTFSELWSIGIPLTTNGSSQYLDHTLFGSVRSVGNHKNNYRHPFMITLPYMTLNHTWERQKKNLKLQHARKKQNLKITLTVLLVLWLAVVHCFAGGYLLYNLSACIFIEVWVFASWSTCHDTTHHID